MIQPRLLPIDAGINQSWGINAREKINPLVFTLDSSSKGRITATSWKAPPTIKPKPSGLYGISLLKKRDYMENLTTRFKDNETLPVSVHRLLIYTGKSEQPAKVILVNY